MIKWDFVGKMADNPKRLIFSMPRTGSSVVFDLLVRHFGVSRDSFMQNGGEFFNLENYKTYSVKDNELIIEDEVGNYDELDVARFQERLALFNAHKDRMTVMKVHSTQIEPGMEPEMMDLLNENFDVVIFLRRTNVLEQMVSRLIANEIGLFNTSCPEEALQARERISGLKIFVEKSQVQRIERQCESFDRMALEISKGKKTYEFAYEDLVKMTDKEICQKLGLSSASNGDRDLIKISNLNEKLGVVKNLEQVLNWFTQTSFDFTRYKV